MFSKYPWVISTDTDGVIVGRKTRDKAIAAATRGAVLQEERRGIPGHCGWSLPQRLARKRRGISTQARMSASTKRCGSARGASASIAWGWPRPKQCSSPSSRATRPSSTPASTARWATWRKRARRDAGSIPTSSWKARPASSAWQRATREMGRRARRRALHRALDAARLRLPQPPAPSPAPACGIRSHARPGTSARPMSDDAPVLERAWAARAGLGFVGKNGLVITPGVGSFILLGEVVSPPSSSSPMLPWANGAAAAHCASTLARRRHSSDLSCSIPRRCISYLTIELRGEMPEESPERGRGAPLRMRRLSGRLPLQPPHRRAEAPLSSASALERDLARGARAARRCGVRGPRQRLSREASHARRVGPKRHHRSREPPTTAL